MKVISLGLGVQSTALYLLSATGRFERADYAIFSDLGAERKQTYENLRILQGMELPIPIIVTENNLYRDILNQRTSTGHRFVSIPAFTIKGGMLWRQCTNEYKIRPVQREVRKLFGLRRGQRMRPVEIWLGISVDEADRMKPSPDYNVTNRFPLIELGLSRRDCAEILKEFGVPAAKSSCVFCPYQADASWKEIMSDPDSKEKALAADEAIRDMTARGIDDQVFLHVSRKPLKDVDFDKQGELFSEECSGYCFL